MAAKVLIQLCVALFVVVLTFVTGVEQTDKPMMCMAVAFVLHYFTLVSFFWMLMEASFMYHAFVKVWPPRQGGDIYKSTIVAWGMSLLLYLTNIMKLYYVMSLLLIFLCSVLSLSGTFVK